MRDSEELILKSEELSEIASCIKNDKPKGGLNNILSAIPIIGKMIDKTKWSRMLENCKLEKINELSIIELSPRYDLDNKRFKYVFPYKH